jgi:hypothetical protein
VNDQKRNGDDSTDTATRRPKPNAVSRRRFMSPGQAWSELYDSFNSWCEILTAHSLQASYAIIAANWAVHKGVDAILKNPYAKASMAFVILFLGLNLLIAGIMTLLHFKQLNYAEDNPNKWQEDFEQSKKHWPYTKCIEDLGLILRGLKICLPFVAAILFLISLFA